MKMNYKKNRLNVGDIVQHFKREILSDPDSSPYYIYKIVGFATHTETKKMFVVYRALYDGFGVRNGELFIKPYDMFMSKVDKNKYPNIRQKFRFEKIDLKSN